MPSPHPSFTPLLFLLFIVSLFHVSLVKGACSGDPATPLECFCDKSQPAAPSCWCSANQTCSPTCDFYKNNGCGGCCLGIFFFISSFLFFLFLFICLLNLCVAPSCWCSANQTCYCDKNKVRKFIYFLLIKITLLIACVELFCCTVFGFFLLFIFFRIP